MFPLILKQAEQMKMRFEREDGGTVARRHTPLASSGIQGGNDQEDIRDSISSRTSAGTNTRASLECYQQRIGHVGIGGKMLMEMARLACIRETGQGEVL